MTTNRAEQEPVEDKVAEAFGTLAPNEELDELALPQLRSARFRTEREKDWKHLEALVQRAEKSGPSSLSFSEAKELAGLYRQAANGLSVAREISLDRAMQTFLEGLCARAYLIVYAPQESVQGVLTRFLRYGAPGAMRRSALALLLAFVAFFGGALVAYLLYFEDPSWYDTLMPNSVQQGRSLSSSREELLDVIYGDEHEAGTALAAFATMLFSHNTRIALMCFAIGIAFCIPSFILTFINGLILGAFFALHVDRGIGIDLLGWLSIHGVTELSALIIASAGGFRLGLAVLFPGRMTRRAALRHHGPDATKLGIMAAIMLFIAALLEGFGRQLITDLNARLIIGWGIGFLWLLYFLFAGRGEDAGNG